jgi:choline-sulfatase
MNFFEGAGRIPLSVSMPGKFVPRRVSMPASAMDVLPTLLELAGVDESEMALPSDGKSLVGAALGNEDAQRMIACEYMAEGSVSSLLMLRQGDYKYIYCKDDPVQLYNLKADPLELNNIASDPAYANTLLGFEEQMMSRWNLDALDDDVRENQQRRIVCYEALRQGRYTPWDHQPVQNASQRFMRNHLDLNEVEAGSRVSVKPATPPMNHGSN